jgi:hypothetical protein
METKCSCHKSCSWEVVILQEGGYEELAAKNDYLTVIFKKDRCRRYPGRLGETNP